MVTGSLRPVGVQVEQLNDDIGKNKVMFRVTADGAEQDLLLQGKLRKCQLVHPAPLYYPSPEENSWPIIN